MIFKIVPKLPVIFAYLTIYIVWGSTYLAMRWAVESFPVYYLVSTRFFFGGLGFILISLATRKLNRMPTIREFLSASFFGIFLLIGGSGLVSAGLLRIDSYLSAIIISATPFSVAVFNRMFFKEKLSRVRLLGIILGFLGVTAILYTGKNPFSSIDPYIILTLGGLISWSFATSIGHMLKVYPNNLVNSGLQMIIAGLIAFVMSQFLYQPLPELISNISHRSAFSLLYLSIMGSAAYYAYTYLIAHEPSIRIVSYTIVNPLIAVLLGLALGRENPAPLLALSIPFIISGLIFMLYGESLVGIISGKLKRKYKEDESFDSKVKE
ncbi:MAG: EamA family transporter [Spirochaetota bacterium]